MKLKYQFETVTIGNSLQMIPVGCDIFNGVVTVNESMKDIMDLLVEEMTEEEVVSAMLDLYSDVTQDEMTLTIRKVCADLRKEGLLAE